MRFLKKIIVVIASLFVLTAHAGDAEIRKALAQLPTPVKPDTIIPTPIGGIYEVMVGSNIFYISEDGKYIFQGSILDVASRTDLTELKRSKIRGKLIASIDEANTVVFAPEDVKHKVFIFTDIDCGYCRKLHSNIDQYLALGIKVQYLLFPRAGAGSPSYDKAVAVWCSDDRAEALTLAKRGVDLGKKTCANPVIDHLELGWVLGLSGTPMIVTEKGTIFPGYLPPEQLIARLKND